MIQLENYTKSIERSTLAKPLKNVIIHTNTHSPIYLVDDGFYNRMVFEYGEDYDNLPTHIINMVNAIVIDFVPLVIKSELLKLRPQDYEYYPYKHYLLQKIVMDLDMSQPISIYKLLVSIINFINSDSYLYSLFSKINLKACNNYLEQLQNYYQEHITHKISEERHNLTLEGNSHEDLVQMLESEDILVILIC